VEEFSEIEAVWRGETKRAMASGRFVALVILFLMAEGLALTVVGFLNAKANEQFDSAVKGQGLDPAVVRTQVLAQKKQFLGFFMSAEEDTLEAIVVLPIVLLFVYSLTTFFAPLLIALMGFDQMAGEMGPKSIRFLVVRVRRSSIVLGKFLSQITMLTVLLSLCVFAMVAVAKILNPDFSWALTLQWGAKLLVAMVVIGSTYAALTALCSSLVKVSALALFLNICAIIGFWFIGLVGNAFAIPGHKNEGLAMLKSESVLGFIRYVVPSQFERNLLSPMALDYSTGILAHLGFIGIFLGLSLVAISRRDL
jgi:ABC-type transport system involved in multi-copper enzyme maturation permease subunit